MGLKSSRQVGRRKGGCVGVHVRVRERDLGRWDPHGQGIRKQYPRCSGKWPQGIYYQCVQEH